MVEKEWESLIELYRSKDADLWICSWLDKKRSFEKIRLVPLAGLINKEDIPFPFSVDDLVYGWKLRYPEKGNGMKIYPYSLSTGTDDIIKGLPGLKEEYKAFDPKISRGPKGIGLTVLQFSPDSLPWIIKMIKAHPYMAQVPYHELSK